MGKFSRLTNSIMGKRGATPMSAADSKAKGGKFDLEEKVTDQAKRETQVKSMKVVEGRRMANDGTWKRAGGPVALLAPVNGKPPSRNVVYERMRTCPADKFAPIQRQSLEARKRWMYGQLAIIRVPTMTVNLKVQPESLMNSSFDLINSLDAHEFHKQFTFQFEGTPEPAEGELGVDQRQCITMIAEEVFDTESERMKGLFVTTEDCEFNREVDPQASLIEGNLDRFKFIGRLIGKAMFEKSVLKAPLSERLISQILQRSDTPTEDEEFAKIQSQVNALADGLFDVVPICLVAVFDPREILEMVNGAAYLDVADWKKFTQYMQPLHSEHQTVLWFWELVEKRMGDTGRSRLLQFVTGATSAPLEGFKSLENSHGAICPFAMESLEGTADAKRPLPKVLQHSNRLQLPEYTSIDDFQKFLLEAVQSKRAEFGRAADDPDKNDAPNKVHWDNC